MTYVAHLPSDDASTISPGARARNRLLPATTLLRRGLSGGYIPVASPDPDRPRALHGTIVLAADEDL